MKKVLVIGLFILIILNSLYSFSYTNKNDYWYNNNENFNIEESMVLKFEENDEIIQTIIPKEDRFYKIRIYLDSLYNNYRNDDYIIVLSTISLKDENQNLIVSYKYENFFCYKQGYIDFEFDEIENAKGKKYYLVIEKYKVPDEHNLLIRLYKNNNTENVLWVNGEPLNYTLNFDTIYKTNAINALYMLFFISISIVFLLIIVFVYKNQKEPLEKIYVIIAMTMCVIMLTSPTYIGGDEIRNYERIYDILRGNIITKNLDNWPQAEVPQKMISIKSYSYFEQIKKINLEESEENVLVNMEWTSVYSPISYIPQIIGLIFSKMFITNSFFWPYFVRFAQALFCVACIYYAIKIIPFGKEVIFLIGLIPSTIKGIALISSDSLLIATTMLFIAKILQIIYEKNVMNRKDKLLLFLLALIISVSKLVYCPIVFLMLLIPLKQKEKNNKNLYYIIFIIILVLFMTFIWNVIALHSLTSGQGINTAYIIKYYISRPIEFIQIVIHTLVNQIGNFINDVFGGENKWYGKVIDDASIIPQAFFCIYIILIMQGKNILDKKDKIFISLIIVATYILISISLLVGFSPVNSVEIEGIQGRYFIPLLVLLYFVFAKNIKGEIKWNLPLVTSFLFFTFCLNHVLCWI